MSCIPFNCCHLYGQGTKKNHRQSSTDCLWLLTMHIDEFLTCHGVVVPMICMQLTAYSLI